jgi:hypothetical protein
MTGPEALKAAYAVTWIIPLLYLRYILTRFRKARRELNDLKRSS